VSVFLYRFNSICSITKLQPNGISTKNAPSNSEDNKYFLFLLQTMISWSVFLFEDPEKRAFIVPDGYVTLSGDSKEGIAAWPHHIKAVNACYNAIAENPNYPPKDWQCFEGRLIRSGCK
jgi:hypothetical protein